MPDEIILQYNIEDLVENGGFFYWKLGKLIFS